MYKYPYGDSQQLNLDWVLTKLKELEASGGSGGADLEEVSNALISLTYNTSTAYRRYDYAFLNGKLYRCLTDTSGVFDPTAWQEALIGDDLAVLTRWINAIDAAAVVDVKFDTSGTNGKIQQKYHDQYHDVVEVDYTPVQNSKRPLSSNAGYELNGAINSSIHVVTTTALTSADDLNDFTTNGLWRIGGSAPQHSPSNINTWIVFMVSGVDTTKLQTIFDTSGTELTIYQRSGGSNYWNSWQKISSADISTISSAVSTLQSKVSALESATNRVTITPAIVGTKFSLVSYDTTKANGFCFGSIVVKCESDFDAGLDGATNYIQMPFTRAAYGFQPVFVRTSQWSRDVVSIGMAYCPTNGKIDLINCTAGQYLTIIVSMPVIY